jgi:hypothetical protein
MGHSPIAEPITTNTNKVAGYKLQTELRTQNEAPISTRSRGLYFELQRAEVRIRVRCANNKQSKCGMILDSGGGGTMEWPHSS